MSTTLKPVKAIETDEGDWYVIPNELAKEFRYFLNRMISCDYEDYVDEFEKKFDKYKTGGDLNLIQLYAEI